MATVKLQYIMRDRDRHGTVRFYFRRPGKPKVRLPGLPGSDEFMAAYRAALAEHGAPGAKAEKSLDWLCDRYYKSAYFQKLDRDTRYRKRLALDEVCNITFGPSKRLGVLPFAGMNKAHVRKLLDMKADTPVAANQRFKHIAALFSWALKSDLAKLNPAVGVEKLIVASTGFYTWTEADALAFERAYPIGSRERVAYSVMLYLGVRRSDAVRLGPQHESADKSVITFQVHKGRGRAVKILTLPILPPLREVLDAGPLCETAYLIGARGKPHGSEASFGNWFRDACRAIELPECTPHGLRKIAAVRCAEAGASEHELMAMFGWDKAEMARVYTRAAAQKLMAASAATKMNGRKRNGD